MILRVLSTDKNVLSESNLFFRFRCVRQGILIPISKKKEVVAHILKIYLLKIVSLEVIHIENVRVDLLLHHHSASSIYITLMLTSQYFIIVFLFSSLH